MAHPTILVEYDDLRSNQPHITLVIHDITEFLCLTNLNSAYIIYARKLRTAFDSSDDPGVYIDPTDPVNLGSALVALYGKPIIP